ncbi:uncharacterized protein KY384_007341 [Bacidia gigantensis]|uniref:uncharacterized protein n=1 Tax=Bacidia gigantensis TaxID=2732470 RepID=UPI001D037E32|nr:uncharacterized protein KY384_007341 [Bacidia gigantensis]KAG8528423.1 hypothetical protein KY384_007341 [Bacidia gigantensis]
MMVTNVPMMFVAKFATDIGMKPSDQALALSLVFGGSILSTFASGWLSDRGFTQGVMGFEAILSSAIHFLLLGFSKAKVAVFTYAICIGIVGGGKQLTVKFDPTDSPGYANSMIAFYAEVSQGDGELFTAIHSLFSFFNGAAILSVGPLGTYLLRLSPIVEMEAYAIGKYKSSVWFLGKRKRLWSSLRQSTLRLVICLPTSRDAGKNRIALCVRDLGLLYTYTSGTLITNFTGSLSLAKELSSTVESLIMERQSLGQQLFTNVWTLAFFIMRTLTEELDPAFGMLDPINPHSMRSPLPDFQDLPSLLEKSNNLARIDRYLASLEESVSFLAAARQSLSQAPTTSQPILSLDSLADFETARARERLLHQQKLCRTYVKQYEALTQMVILQNDILEE